MDNSAPDENWQTIVGNHLKTLRVQKKWDQKQLAQKAGLGTSIVAKFERGHGGSFKNFLKVVCALGKESWLMSLAPVISINPLHLKNNKPKIKSKTLKNE